MGIEAEYRNVRGRPEYDALAGALPVARMMVIMVKSPKGGILLHVLSISTANTVLSHFTRKTWK